MVRNTGESGCIHHQQDQFNILFVNCFLLNISHILLQEFSVWRNIIVDHHEKSTTHRDYANILNSQTRLRV